jgi:hypothetical protein
MARKHKSHGKGQLPKGAYRLPTGGYMTSSVYRGHKTGKHIVIHGVVRDEPDVRKIARAIIELVGKQMLEQQADQGEEDQQAA